MLFHPNTIASLSWARAEGGAEGKEGGREREWALPQPSVYDLQIYREGERVLETTSCFTQREQHVPLCHQHPHAHTDAVIRLEEA